MNVEYLAGIKPGDIIDLSRFDKNKKEKELTKDSNLGAYLPFLNEALTKIAAKKNLDFPGFLNSDNRISIEGRESESDKKIVAINKKTFSAAAGKTIESWQRDTEKNPANLTEMALTILLQKFLGEDFIIARSSEYDDYNNGVDQVIIYKPTGEVVCGIDEVISKLGEEGSQKKVSKLENIMAKGGAHIKYGAKLENGQLVRAELRNIPAFYMSLSKLELGELLESLESNPDKKSEYEQKIFSKLLDSLESQAAKQNLAGDLKIKTDSMLEKFRGAVIVKDTSQDIAA
jgi:hypothetical protein